VTAPRVSLTGTTDVGRVREANEDDFLVGTSIVAVADGMGGHLAGEVASSTALEPVKALDGTVFDDHATAIEALREAVIRANETVSRMAEDEPTYRGMGTTLTAALIEGRRLHVAHVGDSRAYLLRHGELAQITDDHTLVQHLIDEGQITREEATTHPQRSIITRAIGVSRDIEVDAVSIELEPGDQILLCSDGLTGVVEDEVIAAELLRADDPDETLRRLIAAANQGGGPDNITAVLVRYGEPLPPAEPGADAPTGDAGPVRIGTRDDDPDADWAGRLGNYGALGRGGGTAGAGDDEQRSTRSLGRIAGILFATLLLLGLAFFGGRFLLDRSYFVGLDGDEVVIFQGVDAEVGPVSLSRVFERTGLDVDEVASYYRPSLENGRPATDLADARRIVNGAPRSDGADGAAGAGDPDDGATTDPGDDTTADPGDDTTGAADDDAEDSDGGTP
jgi:PPM family protein phosphatase